jgi:DNA-binding transcriptional MerR regulator
LPDTLLIGELAEATGRSIHTLRWYEREGLLPGVHRDRGNRRVYLRAHISWLRFLARLKRTGMTIREMKAYAELTAQGGKTASLRERLLVEHREKLDQQIATLMEARGVIDMKIEFYREWRTTGQRPAEPNVPPLADPPGGGLPGR